MSKQDKSEEPSAQQAQRKLRLSNCLLLCSFALAAMLLLMGINAMVALALLVGGVAKAYGLARESKKELDELERRQSLKEAALSLGLRLSSLSSASLEMPEQFSGEAQDLKERAGIELVKLCGFLNGRPVFMFAVKGQSVYEYDTMLAAAPYPSSDSLVINELVYAPASQERSLEALALRG